jgi:hypothetical protein
MKMSQDFIDLIKSFQLCINNMNITNNVSWCDDYPKVPILFEGQYKGHPDKIKNHFDVNKMLDGFLEKYNGIYPNIYIIGLFITKDNKGKNMISLILESQQITSMRMELINNSGYYFDNCETVVKNFKKVDGGEDIIIEKLGIEMPIINESNIKKSVNIYGVYTILCEQLLLSNISNNIIQPTSFVYETENKRGNKITLW